MNLTAGIPLGQRKSGLPWPAGNKAIAEMLPFLDQLALSGEVGLVVSST